MSQQQRHTTVKLLSLTLLSCLIFSGCATSTIESRKKERPSAYQSLPPEWKSLVDEGQIRVGMPKDAVYLAWGKPADVVVSENERGMVETWLYHGSWMQETRYWSYREVSQGGNVFLERYLDRDYNPRSYVSAEITFVDGVVKQWRTLPRPAY